MTEIDPEDASGMSSANVLGKYRLIAELGRGGMADVYLAVAAGRAGFNKLLVLKKIRPQLAEDPEFLSMFMDEARLAALLNHPNIVQTNEIGEASGQFYIVMEYLDGQPLNRILHRIGRNGQLPLELHLRILSEALGGLHHAHELTDYDGTPLHVVHRDATPHNVFVTYDGQVKLVDFGIAKAMNSSAETRTGVLKGKVGYMSPEHARGDRVDRRSDVFSAGIMMWEALAERRIWKGMNDLAVLNRLMTGDIPTPSSVNPNVPPRLEAICMRAISTSVEDRHATALELQTDIDEALEELGLRGSMKSASRLVARHFEPERCRLKAIIEEQLRQAKLLPTGEYRAVGLPLISYPKASPSDSPVAGDGISYVDAPSAEAPVSARDAATTSNSGRMGVVGATSDGSSLNPSMSSLGPSRPSTTAPKSRRVALTVAMLAAGAMFASAAVWASKRTTPKAMGVEGDRATIALAPMPTGAPAVDPAPAPSVEHDVEPGIDAIQFKVSASPKEAVLFLDGKKLPTNPYEGAEPEGGGLHELRAVLLGHQTLIRHVTFERDLEVELLLERERQRTIVNASTPAPRAGDEVSAGKRKLDSFNPYGQ